MIDAVLFDLDDTLLDRDSTVRRFVAAQHQRFERWLERLPLDTYVELFMELDNHGYVWKDTVYKQILSEFGITGLDWRTLLADYEAGAAQGPLPFPDAYATLGVLQSQGLRLGLITNGLTAMQQSKIDALGLGRYMQAMLISEQEGVWKPDPEIFRRALQRLGVPAERAVFVGDNPEADVAGALGAGLRAVWKRAPHFPPPAQATAVIDRLGELPLVLRTL